jgi:hypothetical protein
MDPYLKVSPTVMVKVPTYFNVSWTSPAESGDWVGMYLEGEDPQTLAPIKYLMTPAKY